MFLFVRFPWSHPLISLLPFLKSPCFLPRRASWEQGTLAQGLLELEAASWTGFANDQYSEDAPFDILRFGARAVANQDSVGRLVSIRVCTRSGNPTLSKSFPFFLAVCPHQRRRIYNSRSLTRFRFFRSSRPTSGESQRLIGCRRRSFSPRWKLRNANERS